MKRRLTGIKEASIGVIGEFLNLITYGFMDGETQTYQEVNMLPHAYTLKGIGKIFSNTRLVNEGEALEKKADADLKQRREFFKSLRSND